MKIGFIGSGNMASAIIGGLINANLVEERELFVSDYSKDALDRISKRFPLINTTQDNLEYLSQLDYLFLAVKPHIHSPVIAQIREGLQDHTVVITIAAGQTSDRVLKEFGKPVKLVRTMPNTPALVGMGMTAVTTGDRLDQKEVEEVLTLLRAMGKVEILSESLFDVFTALCGSGPAYVFMFIEAMADGAVREGVPREKAYTMAAQTILGSAQMVLETGIHPAVLKDQVCSPGGTAIEAVGSLEKTGFRSSVMEAIRVCTEKSIKLSKG